LQTEECFIAIPNTVELNYVETQGTVVTESDFDRTSISKMCLLMIND